MPKTRGPSSREALSIEWEHPTGSKAVVSVEGRTTAAPQRQALSAAEAVAAIAGEDKRPMIVLRECLKCSGTEDALMSSKEDNERTYLLARWFHCVKLPPDVLEEDHPFRDLFPGDKPAHLYISNWDGSARHDLAGEHSRRELWGALESAIEANYAEDHAPALQKLGRLLDSLDEVDASLTDLETRFELAVAEGTGKAKVVKLQKEMGGLRERRTALLAEAVEISRLELDPVEPAAAR
jgi:hypothetical protein